MNEGLADRTAIRELVDKWVVARDSADWETFKSLWHPGGTITALWYQGSWEGYLQRSQEAWGKGMSSVHYICGSTVEVKGDRATSRANMVMYGRGSVDGQEYDLEVVAQFYDFFERLQGQWGMVDRCVVHVKDRIDPARSAEALTLDRDVLSQLPAHYRNLAYINTRAGRPVKLDMPGLFGPAADKLWARGAQWLEGRAISGVA